VLPPPPLTAPPRLPAGPPPLLEVTRI
jgi:hypothetical protein